jgi:hypothetical protein
MHVAATIPHTPWRAWMAAGALLIPTALAAAGLYRAHLLLVPEHAPRSPSMGDLVVFVVGMGVLVAAHEALHALAARLLAGLPWRRIRVTFAPARLGVGCTIGGRTSVRAHRRIGATPVVVTAAVTTAWLLLTGAPASPFLLTCAVVISAGDLVMLGALRRFDAEDIVAGSTDPPATYIFQR